ncbi:peroxisomal leader peptide-processing protease-like [Lineus longissimus]|uniref:peroxisomal leader peptide-processing protease-like n=1 Tax=Lineus longissimus TaxID=88925 RepID=UPI00315D86F8
MQPTRPHKYVTCVVQALCRGGDISSSSGLLFDHEGGVVLTHSTFLLPHLSRSNLTMSTKSLEDELSFSVILEKFQVHPLPDESREKQSVARRTLLSLKAKFVGSFRCEKFGDDLLEMMPQNQGWKFAETPHTTDDKESSKTKSGLPQDESESFFFHMLQEFVILQIEDFKLHENDVIYRKLALLTPSDLAVGDNLYVLGTPFGDSSPHIFMNSVSKGILSIFGSKGALLLTDARCIPGEEGGIVLTDVIESDDLNQRCIIGMVVAPLCWKAGELVGLSLVCNIISLLSSLVKNFPEYKERCSNALADRFPRQYSMTCIPSAVRTSCVLVRCSIHWGSGVLLDARTVLTCSHVVQGSKTVIVHIDGKIVRGRTIYATPTGDPFDVAVVSLDLGLRGGYGRLTFAESLIEGEDVFSIGYPLFDERCSDTPTITKGIVSKVNCVDGLAVMIQTDCVINQGASGGLLINSAGEIMGIVACNCRDTEMKASYPHVNLAIPTMAIMPTVKEYLRTRDVGVLVNLHVSSPAVRRLWSVDLVEQKDLKSKL